MIFTSMKMLYCVLVCLTWTATNAGEYIFISQNFHHNRFKFNKWETVNEVQFFNLAMFVGERVRQKTIEDNAKWITDLVIPNE